MASGQKLLCKIFSQGIMFKKYFFSVPWTLFDSRCKFLYHPTLHRKTKEHFTWNIYKNWLRFTNDEVLHWKFCVGNYQHKNEKYLKQACFFGSSLLQKSSSSWATALFSMDIFFQWIKLRPLYAFLWADHKYHNKKLQFYGDQKLFTKNVHGKYDSGLIQFC